MRTHAAKPGAKAGERKPGIKTGLQKEKQPSTDGCFSSGINTSARHDLPVFDAHLVADLPDRTQVFAEDLGAAI